MPNPSEINPYLLAALACDSGSTDPSTHKKNLIGIFDSIAATAFPMSRPVMLYIKFTDAEGYYPVRIELVKVATGEVGPWLEGDITINDRLVATELLISFEDAEFPEPGRYEFRIKMSNRFLGNITIDATQL